MKVKITVKKVAGFCCYGVVERLGTQKTEPLHTTREFPYGFNAQAYEAAESYATEKGWTVVDD